MFQDLGYVGNEQTVALVVDELVSELNGGSEFSSAFQAEQARAGFVDAFH